MSLLIRISTVCLFFFFFCFLSFNFWLTSLFATVEVPIFKDGRVHFRNSRIERVNFSSVWFYSVFIISLNFKQIPLTSCWCVKNCLTSDKRCSPWPDAAVCPNIIQLLTIEVLDMACYPPENTNIDRGDSLGQYWYSMVNINVITSIVNNCFITWVFFFFFFCCCCCCFLLITVTITVNSRPH